MARARISASYESTQTRHLNIVEDFPFIQFESAVDVTDFHIEQEADQFRPGPAINFSYKTVLTVQSVAADNIILLYQRQQRRHFVDIKLAVAIGIKNKFFSGCFKPGLQCGPITEISGMVHHFYSAVSAGDFIGDLTGGVRTAIVNDNYFKVSVKFL